MVSKRWILREQKPNLARELAAELDLSPLVAQVLINRGLANSKQGRDFLDCNLDALPDPFLMKDMDLAVQRIKQAITQGEKIVIYGDYDADGQTATALLVRALRKISKNENLVQYYLPDRLAEGYGLHEGAVTYLAQEYSLLISVDCGISAIQEADLAQKLGLDLIITDHHEPGSSLPQAVAILNPKQPACTYPSKDLAGVGVAVKLVQALAEVDWLEYLDLVTLGTVADLVPLRGENRIYVHHGLKQMLETKNLGIQALLQVSEVETPSASDVGFRLGPRLNAAGRLGDSSRGVKLLLTEEPNEARELAWELHEQNVARQNLEAKVLEEAIGVVEKYNLDQRSALVVWGEGWHQGVVGIVASRLVDKYYLPTVVCSVDNGQVTASARSISGLDLYQTLRHCEPLLTKYGGHTMAAGLSLTSENLKQFQKRFEDLCQASLDPDDYIPELWLDGFATLDQITPQLIAELARLEPHGIANPGPTFQTQVAVVRTRTLGQEQKHLSLTVQDHTASNLACVAFGLGQAQNEIEQVAENVELAFVPRFNEWRGERTIQLQIQAWKQGTPSLDYVGHWMASYPWQLPASFYQSRARSKWEKKTSFDQDQLVDLRGTWDKVEAIQKKSLPSENCLILVNTAAEVLEVCRKLRIVIPGAREFIGFEHEWLTEEERVEFSNSSLKWIVSTGHGLAANSWPQVWLWDPPLTAANFALWTSLVTSNGELSAVYGPKDVRRWQIYLQRAYPQRQILAQVYAALRQLGQEFDLAQGEKQLQSMGLVEALPVAVGVFQELGLWKVEQGKILYQPAPAQKLDLQETVLYNESTLMRKQSLDYLKRSLERGFFQDGLKREN